MYGKQYHELLLNFHNIRVNCATDNSNYYPKKVDTRVLVIINKYNKYIIHDTHM